MDKIAQQWLDVKELFNQCFSPFLLNSQEQCDHGFKQAMKLEAVNPLSPENIHVATVTRVRGQYIWLSLEGEMLHSKKVFILEGDYHAYCPRTQVV